MNGSAAGRTAVVVFTDSDLWWLRGLKRGFRHCLVAVADGAGWIVCDPLAGRIALARLVLPAGADLLARCRAAGLTAVACRVRPGSAGPAPWFPFTCVEAVKRVIGLRERRILTPWRLFRRLAAEEKSSSQKKILDKGQKVCYKDCHEYPKCVHSLPAGEPSPGRAFFFRLPSTEAKEFAP
jgi:hypothetical protein